MKRCRSLFHTEFAQEHDLGGLQKVLEQYKKDQFSHDNIGLPILQHMEKIFQTREQSLHSLAHVFLQVSQLAVRSNSLLLSSKRTQEEKANAQQKFDSMLSSLIIRSFGIQREAVLEGYAVEDDVVMNCHTLKPQCSTYLVWMDAIEQMDKILMCIFEVLSVYSPLTE